MAEAQRLRPEVIVLDARLPDRTGVEACRGILSGQPVTHGAPPSARQLDEPSAQERRILPLITHGQTGRDIARALTLERTHRRGVGEQHVAQAQARPPGRSSRLHCRFMSQAERTADT
jgi:DNA-binding NarL/FixJ family response regulator